MQCGEAKPPWLRHPYLIVRWIFDALPPSSYDAVGLTGAESEGEAPAPIPLPSLPHPPGLCANPHVLSDPKRLRTRGGYGYLVSWKHRLRLRTEPEAAALVERLLDEPGNVEALRAGIGRPEASLDELAEWLVTGLASGALNLLKTRVQPPVFDAPPETDLFDLLPPEEAKAELESLTFEVVEQAGQGVAVHYQVHAPSGHPSGSLPGGERRFIGELEHHAHVEVELSAIQLPLRPHPEVEPVAPDSEREDPGPPAPPPPMGPGATEPEPIMPGPVGPGGEEPLQPAPVPEDQFSAAIFNTGGLCFGTDRETFIPTRLPVDEKSNYRFLTGIDALRGCLEYARDNPQLRLCVVGHADTVGGDASNLELSQRRAQTVQLLLAGQVEPWASLAVQNQTVLDWQAFLTWAHQMMGMNCHPGELDDDLGERTQSALHRFRAAYNARHGGKLAIEGPFVAEDWAAAFACYRRSLAEQLGCKQEELPVPSFTEPAFLGCGEAFPAEHPGADNRESAANRRVDLVFVSDTESPDLLAQPLGSQLYGPECTRQQLSVAASPYAMLRLILHDDAGLPRDGLRCQLLLDDELLESRTAADGYLEFRVPASVRHGILHLEEPGGRGKEVPLELGTLPAVSDDAGVAGRLRNLGYDATAEAIPNALTQFQQRCELDPTGSANDETRDRLELEHGC